MQPTLLEKTPFPGSPYEVQRWRLDNGLTLLVMEDHAAPVFAYQTWFDVGSSNEVQGKTGIAHLFEHLMFKATKNLADGEFDRIMESRGTSTNAATWVDWTFYTSGLPSQPGNLDLVAKMEADRMVNLILNETQLEAEREVVLNERRFRVDNSPDGLLSELLYSKAWSRHPYHWPTIGWEADIRAISLADCMAFYGTYYSPNNATVLVIGDVDTREVLDTLGKHYGPLASKTLPPESFPEDPPVASRHETSLQVEVDKLLVGWRGPSLTSEDRAAALVIESLAFGGLSARVRRALVNEAEIASDIAAMLGPFKYPGLMEVRVEMREGKRAEEAEAILEKELTRFAKEPVPRDELEKARNQVELGFLSGLRSGSDKAEALGNMHVAGGDYRRLFGEVPRVQSVTQDDIRRVAAKTFDPRAKTVVIGRPQ